MSDYKVGDSVKFRDWHRQTPIVCQGIVNGPVIHDETHGTYVPVYVAVGDRVVYVHEANILREGPS